MSNNDKITNRNIKDLVKLYLNKDKLVNHLFNSFVR